ncbi:MAG: signal peptide peptidase SppA [Syntrophobacteraceae bacterium]
MKKTLMILAGLALLVLGFLAGSDFEMVAKPNRIGVIEVKGTIADVQETLRSLKSFRNDPNIKAILVRIDSPGGGIAPSQELYRELKRFSQEKPVVSSLGSVAASGGYYVAVGTQRIISNPGTITGSIGVISYFPNLKDLFEKIGFHTVIVKSGQFKDVGNPGREMTQQEKDLIQVTIDEAHRQFITDVAQGRKLPEEKVREVADGRIFMGETALRLGLVDELGNMEDAVTAAARMGRIEGEPELIYAKKRKLSLLDLLLGSEVSERLNGILEGSYEPLRYQMP